MTWVRKLYFETVHYELHLFYLGVTCFNQFNLMEILVRFYHFECSFIQAWALRELWILVWVLKNLVLYSTVGTSSTALFWSIKLGIQFQILLFTRYWFRLFLSGSSTSRRVFAHDYVAIIASWALITFLIGLFLLLSCWFCGFCFTFCTSFSFLQSFIQIFSGLLITRTQILRILRPHFHILIESIILLLVFMFFHSISHRDVWAIKNNYNSIFLYY